MKKRAIAIGRRSEIPSAPPEQNILMGIYGAWSAVSCATCLPASIAAHADILMNYDTPGSGGMFARNDMYHDGTWISTTAYDFMPPLD